MTWYRENVAIIMKEYLKLSANLRGNITPLFITISKLYKIALGTLIISRMD